LGGDANLIKNCPTLQLILAKVKIVLSLVGLQHFCVRIMQYASAVCKWLMKK